MAAGPAIRPQAATLIAALRAPAGASVPPLPRTVMVLAHPDDETVGAGSRLPRLAAGRLVYLTDGAPRDGADAARHRLCPAAYADLRSRELDAALGLCGIVRGRVLNLGCPDRQACLRLAGLARRLAELFARWQPEAVLTHPYEGGHPDHDAAAFAVHAAVALLQAGRRPPPAVVEMGCYHQGPAGLQAGTLLPDAEADRERLTLRLTPPEQRRKRELLACFRSQAETLRQFPPDVECFRPAPAYDFLRPPHPGPLLYERQPWGISGARFRRLAGQARARLGLERA